MSGINFVSTSLPEFLVNSDCIDDVANQWLGSPAKRQKFVRISRNSGVNNRFFIQPYNEIIKQSGLNQRSIIFENLGKGLLKKSITKTLALSSLATADIDGLLYSSCSMPSIPSVDATVVQELGFSPNLYRLPVFQHGCIGGVMNLSLASRLIKSSNAILVSSLEVCSLVFQNGNDDDTQLVGAAIFSDGAATALVEKGNCKLNFVDVYSYLIPNTQFLMGYDIRDDGFHLKLDRLLPKMLVDTCPEVIYNFLQKNELTINDVDYWLFHPGGKKILDFLDNSLELAADKSYFAREVLAECGNMSSATIFFVLNKFLSDTKYKSNQNVVMMGIGPGLTIELILFKTS